MALIVGVEFAWVLYPGGQRGEGWAQTVMNDVDDPFHRDLLE